MGGAHYLFKGLSNLDIIETGYQENESSREHTFLTVKLFPELWMAYLWNDASLDDSIYSNTLRPFGLFLGSYISQRRETLFLLLLIQEKHVQEKKTDITLRWTYNTS